MKVEYSHYRQMYVQIPERSRKYHFHSGGYVEFTSVASIEITQNGSLVIYTGDQNVYAFAAGQWINFNTDAMGEEV